MTDREDPDGFETDPLSTPVEPLAQPPKHEPLTDQSGMHADDEVARRLDPYGVGDDLVDARPHDRPSDAPPADAQEPDELAATVIALANQGEGSFLHEDQIESLESHLDRDALELGIVPQLVSDATLMLSHEPHDDRQDDETDEEAPTHPRPRANARRSTRHDHR